MSGDDELLEGWLIKRKSKEKSAFFSGSSNRWFRIQHIRGTENEVALCYFKSPKDKEPRGWIYLKDVVEINDDAKSFTLVSPARTMTIEAHTGGEHSQWLSYLVKHSPNANIVNLQSDVGKKIRKNSLDVARENEAEFTKADSKSDKSFGDRLFSRYVQPGEKTSFYHAANGMTGGGGPVAEEGNETGDEESPRQERILQREASVLNSLADAKVDGSTDSKATDREDSNTNTPLYPDSYPKKKKDRERDRERDQDVRGSRDSSSGNSKAAGNRLQPNGNEREDHRLQGGNRMGGVESNASQRMHRHISRDSSPSAGNSTNSGVNAGTAGAPAPLGIKKPSPRMRSQQEIEELPLEAPVRGSSKREQLAQRRGSRQEEQEEDEDDQPPLRQSRSGSQKNATAPDFMYQESNYDLLRSMASVEPEDLDCEDEEAATSGELKESTVNSSSTSLKGRFDAKDEAPTKAETPKSRGAPPPPSVAPPRRASDAAAAAAEPRRSIDDLLRRSVESNEGGSGRQSRQTNSRASNMEDSSSDDDDVDFKAEFRKRASTAARDDDDGMLAMGGSGGTTPSGPPSSKPPRPPGGAPKPPPDASKMPYNLPAINTIIANSNLSNVNRNNTPPRKPGDPGCKADANFASENWDSSDDSDAENVNSNGYHSRNPSSGRAHQRAGSIGSETDSKKLKNHSTNADAKDYNRSSNSGSKSTPSQSHGPGVRADANWLHDDFDA